MEGDYRWCAGKVKKIGKDDLNGKNVPFYLLISNKCCNFAVELPNETDEPVYRYLHTIARNDAETAAQVYSEWIPRKEQIDVSIHASRK